MAVELKSDSDRLAYALALNFATSIRQLPVKVDLPLLGNAVAELLNGGELKMSNSEYGEQMRKLQSMLQEVEARKNEQGILRVRYFSQDSPTMNPLHLAHPATMKTEHPLFASRRK